MARDDMRQTYMEIAEHVLEALNYSKLLPGMAVERTEFTTSFSAAYAKLTGRRRWGNGELGEPTIVRVRVGRADIQNLPNNSGCEVVNMARKKVKDKAPTWALSRPSSSSFGEDLFYIS